MVKNHLKSLVVPRSWKTLRKQNIFITRPKSGSHSISESLPMNIVLVHYLKFAKTRKEAKFILCNKEVFVNGKRVKDIRRPVGLMDVIEFRQIKKYYRMIIDSKRQLSLNEIKKEEADNRIVKIKNKTLLKGKKIQLNFTDGTNMLITEDKYKTGETLVVKSDKITEVLKIEPGYKVLLTGGKHMGSVGSLIEVSGRKIIVDKDGEKYETLKRYAYVIGKEKPIITI